MGGIAFKHRSVVAALSGATALGISLPLSDARAACVPVGLFTFNCTGTTTNAFGPVNNAATTSIIVGSDGLPASIKNTTVNAIDLTVAGAGNFAAVDTGNIGLPSTITGATNGMSVQSKGGASILIGQYSAGGLNANVTGQNGNGIEALTETSGQIMITTAPGTTVLGAHAGIRTKAADGATTITLNGNVTTSRPAKFFDVEALSTGAGPITIGGSGNATSGGIKATSNSTGTGAITIQGKGNTVDLQNSAGIFAVISNTASTAPILITRSGSVFGAVDGIRAISLGSGPISVIGTGPITTAAGDGIHVEAGGGAITIAPASSVNGTVNGIRAINSGAGGINVTTAGIIAGTNGFGITTRANAGATTVTIGADSTVSGNGTITGEQGTFAVRLFSSAGDNITLVNHGTINGRVFADSTGDPTIDNAGTMNGGLSVVGGLILNNSGLFNGNVSGTGISTINNSGIISLINGVPTDVMSVTNFNGLGGTFAIDVSPSTGVADRLAAGTLSGGTSIAVHIVGPAGLISTPIPVITAAALAPGTSITLDSVTGIIDYSIIKTGDTFSLISTVNTSKISATPAGITAVVTALNTGFFQAASAFIAEPPNPVANQINGGPWIRFANGQNDVRALTSAQNPTAFSTAPSKVRTNFNGFQTGIDLGVANIQGTGWNTHLGVTAGQVLLRTNDLLSTTICSDVQVPYFGIYGAVTGHNFFADILVRKDLYGMNLINPGAFLEGSHLDGRALAVDVSAGYRVDLPSSWFVEPSGAFMYSKLKVDTLRVGLDETGTSFGNLVFDPFTSMLGRLGVRVGTTYVVNSFQLALQPFVTGSVWREFAGNTHSTFTTAGTSVPLSISRIGTFGQVGLGVSGQVLQSGLLGFVRGDYRFGDNLTGYALVAGLRYQF